MARPLAPKNRVPRASRRSECDTRPKTTKRVFGIMRAMWRLFVALDPKAPLQQRACAFTTRFGMMVLAIISMVGADPLMGLLRLCAGTVDALHGYLRREYRAHHNRSNFLTAVLSVTATLMLALFVLVWAYSESRIVGGLCAIAFFSNLVDTLILCS